MSRTFISPFRYIALASVIVVVFGVVLGRLVYLHVWEQERLGRIVERNRQKFEVLEASRGTILDAKGNLLATTREVIELGVDPQMIKPEDLDQINALARLIQKTPAEVQAIFSNKAIQVEGPDGEEMRLVRWQKLADAIDEPTYQKIQALGIKAVYGNRKFERMYPGGFLAAHVLGFVNKEGVSAGGVEQFMDFYLRGQHGWRESERDGCRRELAHLRSREVLPTHGLNVELSIDSMVQHTIEQALAKVIDTYHPDSATIIVSDPLTGFILGLANVPSFDPNRFFAYPLETHRNRAITDLFEPGSSFKIVSAAGALTEGLVTLNDEVDCTVNQMEYRGRMVPIPKDYKPMGRLTVEEVIMKSSNRGAAYLGMKLGAERLYDYARAFGYGELTGYGPAGEVRGILHPVNRWDGLTIGRLPMGHALAATPMQVHYAMSVMANQGVLMQPQLVQRVTSEAGETVATFAPRIKRRVLSTTMAHTVSDVLLKGTSASGARAAVPGFEVAGKSGTTQKIVNGGYSTQSHISSFSGYFPASRPRFVITVVVDNAHLKGCGYGSIVAAPVFKEVAEGLIRYYGLTPPNEERNLLALREKKNDWVR